MLKDYKFFNIPIIIYIFLLAAFLRLYNLDAPSIWVDEAFSIWIAKSSLHDLIKYISMDAHPPLYFILLHYWVKLFGASEFAVRLLSVIFGLATVILTYKFCNEIFENKKYGILSSFFLAISSFTIIFTDTDVKMYSQLVFLTLLSTYLLYKTLKKESFFLWTSFTIVSILNLYTHYFAAFVVLSHFAYILIVKRKNSIKNILYLAFIFLISFMPWYNSFLEQMFIFRKGEHLGRVDFLTLPDLFNDFFSIIYVKMALWQSLLFSAFVIIILVIGILRCFKHEKGNIIPPVFFIIIFTPFFISYVTYKHIFQARYLALACPFFFILLSCAILNFKNKYARYLTALIFIALNLTAYYLYVTKPFYWKQDWRAVSSYIEEKGRPGDLILMQISYNIFPFNYYYKNNLSNIKLKAFKQDEAAFLYEINYSDAYLKNGGLSQRGIDYFDAEQLNWLADISKRVILILNAEKFYDPQRKTLKWFSKNCDFIEGVEVENFNAGQSHISIGIFSKKYPIP